MDGDKGHCHQAQITTYIGAQNVSSKHMRHVPDLLLWRSYPANKSHIGRFPTHSPDGPQRAACARGASSTSVAFYAVTKVRPLCLRSASVEGDRPRKSLNTASGAREPPKASTVSRKRLPVAWI